MYYYFHTRPRKQPTENTNINEWVTELSSCNRLNQLKRESDSDQSWTLTELTQQISQQKSTLEFVFILHEAATTNLTKYCLLSLNYVIYFITNVIFILIIYYCPPIFLYAILLNIIFIHSVFITSKYLWL